MKMGKWESSNRIKENKSKVTLLTVHYYLWDILWDKTKYVKKRAKAKVKLNGRLRRMWKTEIVEIIQECKKNGKVKRK